MNKRLNIAVIIDAWYPIVGGGQTHVWEICSRLVKNHNCKIDIFVRGIIGDDGKRYYKNEEFFDGRLRVIRSRPITPFFNIFGRLFSLFTIPFKIRKENKKMKYDIIHAHAFLGGIIGKITKFLINKPLFFTMHGFMNMDRGIKNINYYLEKFILTKIKYDQVISVGGGYKKYKNINKNIAVIPNGVDIERFDKIDIPKSDFFKILFVGRLDWQKGIDVLIESVKIIKEKNEELLKSKKVQFHLIGYGYEEEKYKKMVDDYELRDYIIFRGKITGDELVKEYKSSWLFVLPSISEGQPVTFLEAMASSLPILTTFSADNANIIDNSFGFKCKKKDVKELANKLNNVFNLDKNELNNIGSQGYKKVVENYTWDKIALETFEKYENK